MVFGFFCNQFGQQEFGGLGEIKNFCEICYGVIFFLFEKVEVNGFNVYFLFKFLIVVSFGMVIFFLGGVEDIKWNFIKFLVDC